MPGDGIGPECMAEARRILEWFNKRRGTAFEVIDGLVGGASYEAHGTPLTDETLAKALEVDAVLFGSIGGPKWSDPRAPVRPDAWPRVR